MSVSAHRVKSDVREISVQTFLDSPPVYIDDSDDKICALVVGPPGTPYANVFFFFRIQCSQNYPIACPTVKFLSTDGGMARLNPNLYADGTVCLSILGTWEGDAWRSCYSLLYLLRCLQSMVLTREPFYNEPGMPRHRHEFAADAVHYSHRMFHESFRIGVLQVLEEILLVPLPTLPSMQRQETPFGFMSPSSGTNPETPGLSEVNEFPSLQATPADASPQPLHMCSAQRSAHVAFAPIIKRYAHLWLESYEAALSAPDVVARDNLPMRMACFESTSVGSIEVFQHENLLERLHNIECALESEVEQWKRQGSQCESYCGENGESQEYFGTVLRGEYQTFEVEGVVATLDDDRNPFMWRLLLLNPSSMILSNDDSVASGLADVYEQSMYTAEVVYCPFNRNEPPRVRFLQPIFHPNVSTRRGVPYYFASENRFPLERRYLPSIVAQQLRNLLAQPPLSSETAAVNPEASRLCFSTDPQERHAFLRRARSLAEATLE